MNIFFVDLERESLYTPDYSEYFYFILVRARIHIYEMNGWLYGVRNMNAWMDGQEL